MGWKELTKAERQDLLARKKAGESVSALADEIGANPMTLDRDLRRLAAKGRTKSKPVQEDTEYPTIQPVVFHMRYASKPEPRTTGMSAALILPDPQVGFSRDTETGKLTPFHDRRALDIARQIAHQINPEIVVFLGDLLDNSEWSDKFVRMPEFYFTMQPSLIEAAWVVGQMRGATHGDVVVMDGNHEERVRLMVVKHLMAAYNLRTADGLPILGLDNLLGLSRMGVQYINGYPDGEHWLNDLTRVIHGVRVRSIPGGTASAVVRESDVTTVFGHVHRYELASREVHGRAGSRTIHAYTPGCLCHVDGRVPGSSKHDNWQQGIGIVWYDDTSSFIEHISISNGRAHFRGRMFTGRDYTSELVSDTGWQF